MHVCVKVCTCMLEGERRTWRENNCIHYIIYNEYNLKSKNQQLQWRNRLARGTYKKQKPAGIPWWSNSSDSTYSLPRAQVDPWSMN